MKYALVVLCLLGVALAGDPVALKKYSDNEWNCVEPTCKYRVKEGEYQPNYECAEFVSRCLAAGSYISGIGPNASQHDFQYYKHGGKTYDLLWVSSKQGPPLGLEDLLQALGWKNAGKSASSVEAASVLILVGSDGPDSHTAIGVGHDVTNAHNMARYHKPASVYEGIDAIYHPPS